MATIETVDRPVASPDFLEQAEGIFETLPGLLPCFQQLAVTRQDYTRRYIALRDAGALTEGDELTHGQLARLGDEDFEEAVGATGRSGLTAIVLDIANAVEQDPALYRDGTPDWQGLAFRFLDESLETRTHQFQGEIYRTNGLETAFACSLLAGSQEVRQNFIKEVYSRSLEAKMAVTLREGCLTFIINPASNERVIKRFNNYTAAFKASGREVDYYIEYIKSAQVIDGDPPKPKQRQKEMCAAYQEGVVNPATICAAQAESLVAQEVRSTLIDPHKIERFALEQMFIEEQAAVLFPTGNTQDSPLRGKLAETRTYDTEHPLIKLRDDIQEAIWSLTEPIKTLYEIQAVDDGPADVLTRRQAAAERFRNIWQSRVELQGIAKYINYAESYPPITENLEIWSIPGRGADISRQSHIYLTTLINEALRYSQETGDDPTTEELHRLAQTKRKHLMRIAMINILDLRTLTTNGHMNTPPLGMPATSLADIQGDPQPLAMYRKAGGSLDIKLPLATEQVKGIAALYESITLGCVAGRVAIEGMKDQGRGLHSTDNFIDYLLEIAIDEANERGLFNLENYKQVK